jgi:HlyD family secretion protein
MNAPIAASAIEAKNTPMPVTLPITERPKQEPERPNRGASKHWLIGGAVALVLLAVGGLAWWLLSASAPVRYVTAPATIGAIARGVTSTGTVNPELTIIVGTYVSGVIQELSCDYNTQVKKGQSCARIDPRPYQSVVDQAKANLAVENAQLEKDKAALAYAKVTLDRTASLVPTQAVSKDAFDNAKNLYQQALAQITFDAATVQQRQAVLDAAQINLDYTNIISPVDGTVVSRNVTMGQTVAASFQTPTLFLIATDLTKMQVDANVSEGDIGGVKLGNKATFTVDAYTKRDFEGTVTQVRQSPQTVQNVVTYDVVISVDNSDLALKPGLTAATQIIVDQRGKVLRVPNQALRYVPAGTAIRESDQARVWLLRDGKPEPVQVAPGLDDDNYTEILPGDLKPGDTVIIAEQRDAAAAHASVPRPRL